MIALILNAIPAPVWAALLADGYGVTQPPTDYVPTTLAATGFGALLAKLITVLFQRKTS